MAKIIVRQALFGLPGPQKDPVEWSQLETSLVSTANMLNNMPYLDGDNKLLLAPSDFITPWKSGAPTVQEIPDTKLKSLAEAKRMLTVKQIQMSAIKKDEMATELNRFKQGNLKLGKNKELVNITPGCVVMVELKEHGMPELGVAISREGNNVTVQLRDRQLKTSVGICTPITTEPGQSDTTARKKHTMRIGEEITHFLSLELDSTSVVTKIQKLQDDLGHIEGVGSPMKADSFHITLAVLSIKPEELEHAMAKAQRAVERFLDLMQEKHGFMIALSGAGFGDYGSFWLKASIGAELCSILREYIDDELEGFLTDSRFASHLTIMKNNTMSEESRHQLVESLIHFKTGCIVAKGVTMRVKKDKTKGIQPEVLMNISFNKTD